ncbi:816_t:CDS:10, partial [Paraglomus brasilianum]
MNAQQSYTAGSYGNYALPYVHGPVIQQGTQYYTSHPYTNTQSQVLPSGATTPTPQRLGMSLPMHHIAGNPAAGVGMASMGGQPIRRRPQAYAENSMMMQRKKAKLSDRNMPGKIESIVPESRLYTELQAFEKKLDATISRKRFDIQEALSVPMKTRRTLRVFISNLSANQDNVDTVMGYDPSNPPSWTLKIEGRLLDPPNSSSKSKQPARKFSSFIKSLLVELDAGGTVYEEGNLIEWLKASDTREYDGFEIKRKGNTNCKVKIVMQLDSQPEKYKLSPQLASILDIQEETKSQTIRAMWHYVKLHNLQDPEDKRYFNCNQPLRELFGYQRLQFPQMADLIMRQLQPLDPIVIEYTVRADKEYQQSKYAYDIEIVTDDTLQAKMSSILANSLSQKEVSMCDDKIVQCVQSINNSKIKRDFLLRFAESPVEFIEEWIKSQSSDLELILGESNANIEEQRRSEFYKNDWVHEAIFHYLSAK